MPVDVSALINVVAELCEEKHLRAAATGSIKGGLMTGVAATLGGLIFGPLGLAVGGAIGGAVAATSAQGEFRPVAQILKEMSPVQKQLLYKKINKAFDDFRYEDVIGLITLILSSASLKDLAVKQAVNFLVKDMNLSVKS